MKAKSYNEVTSQTDRILATMYYKFFRTAKWSEDRYKQMADRVISASGKYRRNIMLALNGEMTLKNEQRFVRLPYETYAK